MKHAIATVVLAGTCAVPAWAQSDAGRYREQNEGGRYSAVAQAIPSGYLPPPGACRVWYDGRPAGHQTPATSCADAERVARRDRAARAIYGGDPQMTGRAIPQAGSPRLRYPERRYAHDDEARAVPFEHGFKDGRDEGRDDRSDDKRFDPTQHSRYRAADRGYERRYVEKSEYRETYREGFRAGYAEGYRGVMMTGQDR